MGEQVSKTLLNLLNEMNNLECQELKIEGALFVRRCNKIISEKVNYLEKLLDSETSKLGHKKNDISKSYILKTYRQKLNELYKEYYIQYVNIQDGLQEARFNQRVVMIQYQQLINKREIELKSSEYIEYMNKKKVLMQKLNLANNSKEYNEIYNQINNLKSPLQSNDTQKEKLKMENEKYQRIMNSCNQKFLTCRANFEHQINNEFLVSTQLVVAPENGVWDKIKYFFSNIFSKNKKYQELIENYRNMVDKIDTEKIISQMREDTIRFVEEILDIKENFALAS